MQTTVNLSNLASALGDAIIVSDASGTIIFWNRAAEGMFGYTAAEAIAQTLDLIIPVRLRERHWEGYQKTMETGLTRYGSEVLQVPAIDKTGRTFSIAFTVALLQSSGNKVSGIAAVIRDDSKRFEKDRAQRKRISQSDRNCTSSTFTPSVGRVIVTPGQYFRSAVARRFGAVAL